MNLRVHISRRDFLLYFFLNLIFGILMAYNFALLFFRIYILRG